MLKDKNTNLSNDRKDTLSERVSLKIKSKISNWIIKSFREEYLELKESGAFTNEAQ